MAFDWNQLPRPVLKGLAAAADLDPADASVGLRKRFGKTPSEEFVQQMWPALRAEWLSRDRAAAKLIATALRARGAGNTAIRPTNHDTRIDYLKSCRISKAVREEVLPVLLAAGGGASPKKPDSQGAVSTNAAKTKATRPPAAPPRPENAAPSAPRVVRPSPRDEPAQTRATDDAMGDAEEELAARLGTVDAIDVVAMGLLVTMVADRVAERHQDDSDEALTMGLTAACFHAVHHYDEMVPREARAGLGAALEANPRHLRTAQLVADGAHQWAETNPRGLIEAFVHFNSKLAEQRPSLMGPSAGNVMLAAICLPVGSKGNGLHILELIEWAIATTQAGRPGLDDDDDEDELLDLEDELDPDDDELDIHPVVMGVIAAAGEDEREFIYMSGSSLYWQASSAGLTRITAGEAVKSRSHVVTPIAVSTGVKPTRTGTDQQIAAALSEFNRRNGVTAGVWDDGTLLLHTVMGSYEGVDGWLPRFLGVAMLSSAMAALHLPAELRGPTVPGPEGVRNEPSYLVAEYGGWEVAEDDAHEYAMPSKKELRAALRGLPVENSARIEGDEVMVELAGPNGQLEGWLRRRRGHTDDHLLTVSKVTRPPWGPGVKLVHRIPGAETLHQNEGLALLANLQERDVTPSINIWGGWSGEEHSLRLTMFIPQMLFTGSMMSKQTIVSNFALYGIARANALAVSFGLT
jgi:hypothetical protein